MVSLATLVAVLRQVSLGLHSYVCYVRAFADRKAHSILSCLVCSAISVVVQLKSKFSRCYEMSTVSSHVFPRQKVHRKWRKLVALERIRSKALVVA